MHKANWDDLRYVLAVADVGSVSAAARQLGVNHATVLRRINAFEDRNGAPVFDRTPQGYRVPAHAREVIEALRAVEAAVLGVERRIEGTRIPLQGEVRLTSTDTFCHSLLPELLAPLCVQATELRIELIAANAHLDLARLDADVTVRPAAALPEGLKGQAAARLDFAAYAIPGSAPLKWLGLRGALEGSAPGRWMAEAVKPEDQAGAADSFQTLKAMAAAGIGRAILPVMQGDADPRLEQLEGALPPLSVPIWVASHPDLADLPRIRAVVNHLTTALGLVLPPID